MIFFPCMLHAFGDKAVPKTPWGILIDDAKGEGEKNLGFLQLLDRHK